MKKGDSYKICLVSFFHGLLDEICKVINEIAVSDIQKVKCRIDF